MAGKITLEQLVLRAAAELKPGQVVSAGTGLPSRVPGNVAPDRGVVFLSENGVMGYNPDVRNGMRDSELVDARGEPMGIMPGGAIVDQAGCFGLIRSGHLDVALVEAAEVSETGDLGVLWGLNGGPQAAPDLAEIVRGAKSVVAMMEHTRPDGASRVVNRCTLPLLAASRVNLIVTDAAVMSVTREGLVLKEIAPGLNVGDVQEITGAALILDPDLKEMEFSQPLDGPDSKVFPSGLEAVSDIFDGAVVLMDGFAGAGGMSQYLMTALRDHGAKDLTMVSNTAGVARVSRFGTPRGVVTIDHSMLVDNGQIRKAIASFPVSPSPSRPNSFELVYRRGEAELELVPQGTLAERLRAGANGIVAFYTPTGAGTQVAEGKETRSFGGREHVLEYSLRGDFALIRAHKADTMGNLVYRGTSRNFNAVMAPAAAITIVEVDEIVEVGELDPDAIVTPGISVQRIVRRPDEFYPYEPIP